MFQSTPSGGKATSVPVERTNTRRSFNPRLPGGRRHFGFYVMTLSLDVSIHAFRGEGDFTGSPLRFLRRCFNPRLPGGRRRRLRDQAFVGQTVSIHAFRGEGDYTVL